MLIDELARRLEIPLAGPATLELTGCAALADAGPQHVSFLANPRYRDALATTRAGAVILGPRDAAALNGLTGFIALVADDPYLAFQRAMVALEGDGPLPAVGISDQACIDDTAEVGDRCTARPFAYVGPRARLGKRVVLYPGVYVGKDAVIGDGCVLHPGVCVYAGCRLGVGVTVHAHTSIGQDGLGYATSGGRHHKIPQRGIAVIGDGVEIGANCSIDRATLGETVIGSGTKISDNVVIGHGAQIGAHNLLVGLVGIAGSTTTGDHVTLGGHAGLSGHLTIGRGVRIAADAKVMHDIPDGEDWGGTPATPFTETKRVLLAQKRLPDLLARMKRLERRVKELEG